jgi:hypothetical protein
LLFCALSCDSDEPEPSAPRATKDAATPMDAGVGMDAATPHDAGTHRPHSAVDAGHDSGTDSGLPIVCEPDPCPASEVPLVVYGMPFPQQGCCFTGAPKLASDGKRRLGQCGVIFPVFRGPDQCDLIVPGEVDDTCLDTLVNGELVEGCRLPDGHCGHLTPGWGCHTIYRYDWDWYLDDATTTLPNPFVCTSEDEPCTRTTQCCFHDNYGGLCAPAWDADLDAGIDNLPGFCTNDEESNYNDETTPFPRF